MDEWKAVKANTQDTQDTQDTKFSDITISCNWCKKDFIFYVKDQKYFKNRNFENPTKCKDCRLKKKQIFEAKKTGTKVESTN